jgi:predicted alpha-1,2-mannosidase
MTRLRQAAWLSFGPAPRSVLSFFLCVTLCAPVTFAQGALPQGTKDPAAEVNVFIGTDTSPVKDNGLTMPAASLPFGMIAWGPDPDEGAFYKYSVPETRGFSLTHLSGVGCSVLGDVPIMPVNGAITASPAQRPTTFAAHYSHASESASPGFYSVKLDTGIAVELAVTKRAGIATMAFDDSTGPHSVIIDLSRTQDRFGVHAADVQTAGRLITGSVESGGFCSKENRYRVYFAIEAQEAPSATCTYDALGVSSKIPARKGPHIGGCFTFPASTKTVHLRTALSFVSSANALANLRAEIPGWDLEKVHEKARAEWNDALGHIDVSGGTPAQRHVFYSALYHALLEPSLFSDVNGQYYGFDERIHTLHGHEQYANFSGWDIYRSQVQLIAMLFPKTGSDIAQSLVNDAEQGGGLPIWPVAADESSVMVGDPADLILAGLYSFGARGFDTKAALAAMIRGADDPKTHVRVYAERPMLAEYLKDGYVPEGPHSGGSASITLEYANADFAVSRMAAALGDPATAARYLKRSANWRTLLDPDTRYIRPRMPDGSFFAAFTPGNHSGFVEGNSAQYTWMTPYDLHGVVEAVGGDKTAIARLDDYFSQYASFSGGPYFLISNEPSFGDPWVYNWTSRPWRTQEVVTKTLKDLFQDAPGGLPGNDDLGATSSWAVFAMLGFFPEIPGVGGVTPNTPVFPHVTMQLDGHPLSITANDPASSPYIGSIALDGQPVSDNWIPWDRLAHARTLAYDLQSKPNKAPAAAPPSFAPPAN